MAYTTINKSTDYFNTKLYTGNGSAGNAQTGVGFQPDLTWIKCRSQGHEHYLFDVVRGVTKFLKANSTAAEGTASGLTGFDSDGFTLGASDGMNENTDTFVAWNWKAGGSGSSNTDGTITSTVSANTTAGFSIVKYTGTGAVGTIGHGLGSDLDCIVMKQFEDNSGYTWKVYFKNRGANKFTALDESSAEVTNTAYLNNTDPTSSVFTVGADGGSNLSGNDMIAYCFAEKTGFSKFGSYIGNGSGSGPVVYTGFKPSWVLIKKATGTAQDWNMYDNKRLGYNGGDAPLFANLDNAEASDYNRIDFLSNGFKIRTSNTQLNNDNSTYIFMAFGQTIVSSNDIAATAR